MIMHILVFGFSAKRRLLAWPDAATQKEQDGDQGISLENLGQVDKEVRITAPRDLQVRDIHPMSLWDIDSFHR